MDDDGEQIFRCSVADTGIGIAEDKLETIFSSFCQADASTTRKFGGTGLGLSIVKQLCEHMGGEVSVTSTVGVGSCFSFCVNLEPAEVPRSQLPDIDIKDTKVLIIENNPISGEVLQGQLNCWGAKAELVKDVYIAEKFFFSTTSNSEELPFKILFIDNDVRDALEFAQSLRADQRYKELRLVIMTSIGNIGDATYYRSIGFEAYFTKPVTHGDLYSVLKVLIAGGEVLDRAVPLAQRYYLKELQSGESRSKPLGRRTWREGRRILLVEDNLINQELLISILREYDQSCVVANNGVEALDLLRKSSIDEPFDFVLMDCQMPEMDGYETTKKIRSGVVGDRYSRVPVVALTANTLQRDKEKCLSVGMDAHLSKPINIDQLVQTLKEFLGESDTPLEAPRERAGEMPVSTHPVDGSQDGNLSGDRKDNTEIEQALVVDSANDAVRSELITSDLLNVKRALALMSGQDSLYHRLLGMFIEDCGQWVEQLHRGAAESDFDVVKANAHRIKGTAANLGAMSLSDISKRIESAIKAVDSPSADDISVLMTEFDRIHQSTMDEIAGYRDSV